MVKNPPANAGDTRDAGSIPELGNSPGIGNGNPLQYSCLGNSMDRGAWRAAVHGATKSQTQWSDFHFHFFPGDPRLKNPPANAGDTRDAGSIHGSGRSPGGGHGNALQYSCLENPMDRGAWRAMVHSVAQSQKRLK